MTTTPRPAACAHVAPVVGAAAAAASPVPPTPSRVEAAPPTVRARQRGNHGQALRAAAPVGARRATTTSGWGAGPGSPPQPGLQTLDDAQWRFNWPAPPAPADVLLATTLLITPVAKARPRVSPAEYTTIAGRRVKTKNAHAYTPASTKDFEDTVGWLLRRTKARKNTTGRLGVHAVFHVPVINVSDTDNLIKALLDAGTGVVWANDRQVCQLVTEITTADGPPRIDLVIYRLHPAVTP